MKTTKKLTWNRPQTLFFFYYHLIKNASIIGSRGVGKSYAIAEDIRRTNKAMPRATCTIQGASFQQLLTRTLPGTLEALEEMGYARDVDYWINKQPNVKSKYLPYYKPLKWDNFITIKNEDGYCNGYTLLSQDSSARGSNTDKIFCDESLLLDQKKFISEAKFTNRGHEKYFSKVRMHHGVNHYTSMPYGNSWLFKHGEYYGEELQSMISVQNQMIDLQYEFLSLKDNKLKLELYKEIFYLMGVNKWKPNSEGKFYSEWNIFDNIENLGLSYIQDMYNDTPKEIFLIEGLNKRNNKVDNGFYPQLNRIKHCESYSNISYLENLDYDMDKLKSLDCRADSDHRDDLPMFMGTDYGSAINWIIAAQEHASIKTCKVLKNFFVKSPKILNHVVRDFCEYYKPHKYKHVIIYPDAEAFNRRANSPETYIDTTIKILKSYGWSVTLGHRMKYNRQHQDTYHLVNTLLGEQDNELWKIRFNTYNCKELLFSMEQSPAYDHRGKVRKNKDSEKKMKENREEATDAGDAFDQIIYHRYKDKLGGGRMTLIQGVFS
jgi:hypothetical protein